VNQNSKKTAVLATLAISSLLLAGCATGKNSPVSQIKQVTDGAEVDSGAIKVRDFLVVNQGDGSAAIVGTFVNDGNSADQLTGITVNGIAAKLSSPSYALNPNSPVIFSGASANAAGTIPGLNAVAGNRYNATFTFRDAATVQASILVEAKTGYYSNVNGTLVDTNTANTKK
jgi:PBP1b-binding outer membrane lipoprotein LpoB